MFVYRIAKKKYRANFEDALKCTLSTAMRMLLQEAIHLKHQLKEEDYLYIQPGVVDFEKRLTVLLQNDYSKSHNKIQAFTKRLIKNRNSIFTFLYYYQVSADNNGSERAVRMVKIKTKVSGQFRSQEGAKRFAVLHTVVGTAVKNCQNAFDVFCAIENMVPT